MAFMQPEYTNEPMWLVETTDGSEVVPADLVGKDPDAEDFSDYIEGEDPDDYELIEGKFWARLSAPGYMDATSWSGPFDTLDEAKKYVEDTWEVDPDTGDSLEENPKATKKLKAKLLK